MKKIKDANDNICKIYDIEYLMNKELTEEDLYYLFDTASLIYSLVIAEFKYAEYNINDYDIIEIAKNNERWVYEYYWTKKQHDNFIKMLTKVYHNLYQYKYDASKNAAEWFVFQYGLTVKTKSEINKIKISHTVKN